MNENTVRVAAVATKAFAGQHYALTYGPDGITPTGAFIFRKVGNAWAIDHEDYTNDNQVSVIGGAPTLKESLRVAERYVRDLPASYARRRQVALDGARPVSG